MNRTQRKILVAVAVFVLAGGYLAFTGARSSMAYYLTVGELLDRSPALAGADVRLSGQVAAGTVSWDQVAGRLEFTVTDGSRRLPGRCYNLAGDASQTKPPHRVLIGDAIELHGYNSNLLQQHHRDGEPEDGKPFRERHKQNAAGEQLRFFRRRTQGSRPDAAHGVTGAQNADGNRECGCGAETHGFGNRSRFSRRRGRSAFRRHCRRADHGGTHQQRTDHPT